MTRGAGAAVAVVGDFDPRNRTHVATGDALGHAGLRFEWVPTDGVGPDPGARLGRYAGIFVAPASPYRDMEGALGAVRHARERGVPLVGT
jgi:CTP synthase (UTP-ammonia lyase)